MIINSKWKERLSKAERRFLNELNFQEETWFKANQLMEWSTSEIEPREGEKIFKLKEGGIYIAIKL